MNTRLRFVDEIVPLAPHDLYRVLAAGTTRIGGDRGQARLSEAAHASQVAPALSREPYLRSPADFTSGFHDQRSLYAADDGCVQNEPRAHRELIAPHKPSAVDGRRRRYKHESESAAASSPPRDDHGRTFAGALRIALPGLSAENRNFRCLACAAGSLEAAREDILTPEGR
jgi:hypothetical protein